MRTEKLDHNHQQTQRRGVAVARRSNLVRVTVLSVLSCLSLLVMSGTAIAAEEETHLFNATLSLVGKCGNTNALDLVEDPGCPGGVHPPKGAFAVPSGQAVDQYGNRYVASFGTAADGSGGRIDIFDSSGFFITEILGPVAPLGLAVDSKGNLYVGREILSGEKDSVVRYEPSDNYDPAAGEIEYTDPPVALPLPGPQAWPTVAVNPANDHVLVANSNWVHEFNSAAEGNEYIGDVVDSPALNGRAEALAIDAVRNRFYVSDFDDADVKKVVKIFELEPPHKKIGEIDGSTTPSGVFISQPNRLPLAVDEATGHVFVGDLGGATKAVYEFDEDWNPVSTIEHGFAINNAQNRQIVLDDSPTSPTQGYLFVPSGVSPGRSYAFEPIPDTAPPVVEALFANGVTNEEAILNATVNPEGLPSSYRFEYTTQAAFEAEGFTGAIVAGEGTLKALAEGQAVHASASGLTTGTAYRFRVAAENELGADEAQASFTTYVPSEPPSGCPNEALRTGLSALLPDCRAYELVTPADTNGLAPFGTAPIGPRFTTQLTSPQGDAVSFVAEGGILPDTDGTGSFFGDPYLARRGANGWSTENTGPNGVFTAAIVPGSVSPDQGHVFWETSSPEGEGSIEGEKTSYIRYPDGHFEVLGHGSLATEPGVIGLLISENASHVIFRTGAGASTTGARQLEPEAAPDGYKALYDHTPDGITHVISLLPGDVSLPAGPDVEIAGTSLDGRGVAFTVDANALFLRRDNAETFDPIFQARSGQAIECKAEVVDPQEPGRELAGATPIYEWLLDGTPIPSANATTYTPNPSQAGSVLQCVVRAANAEGGSIAAGVPLVVDQAHQGGAPPRPFSGQGQLPAAPAVGQTLSCQSGTWSANPTLSFQWFRNGTPIAGAESASYEVQPGDLHTTLQCRIAAAASGTTTVVFSARREVEAPKPPVAGSAAVANETNPGKAPVLGDQLLCDAGSWQNSPSFAYQWLRNGAPIAAATTPDYTVAAADEGTALQCEVSATTADGNARAVSAAAAVAPTLGSELPSGGLSIKGFSVVGATLECVPGSWQNSPTFAYQWLRDGAPIAAATNPTYTLTPDDHETVVQCALTATNAKGAVLAVAGAGGRQADVPTPQGFVNQRALARALTAPLKIGFAGISEGGRYLFFTAAGDLYRFDTESEETLNFSSSGDATVVNLSADGASAYFTSKKALGSGANPEGDSPQAGEQNLYRSREGELGFIGTVSERDVEGLKGSNGQIRGLGLLVASQASSGAIAVDPSRVTPDGNVALFESEADLSGQNPKGDTQVYRYDATANTLRCLSCNPSGGPVGGDAGLQSLDIGEPLLSVWNPVNNLRDDGKRAFFESTEALVLEDVDGLRDVYQWEDEGVGSCQKPGGCIELISSGASGRPDYLFAVSDSGDDVFFRTADLLLPATDPDETPSIYDARVGGGFAPPNGPAGECLGEACQPAAVAPNDPTPSSSSFEGKGNVVNGAAPKPRCPKGKVRKGKKQRCVAKKSRKHQHSKKRSGAKGRSHR